MATTWTALRDYRTEAGAAKLALLLKKHGIKVKIKHLGTSMEYMCQKEVSCQPTTLSNGSMELTVNKAQLSSHLSSIQNDAFSA